MKFSLAVLITVCAIASSAFAAFDIPPYIPPHSAAIVTLALHQNA